jgi:hypothetical protein
VQAWPFSGQSFSGPPSYRPTAPRPSDPARAGMGSVRSVIHARFRSPSSRVPFALNLLSHKGSPGCSLCCVNEASDYLPYPMSFAQKGRSRLLARIDGLHDRAIGRRTGTAKSQQIKPALVRAEISRRTGYPSWPRKLSRRSPQVTSHPSLPPRPWPNGSISLCSGPRKQKPSGLPARLTLDHFLTFRPSPSSESIPSCVGHGWNRLTCQQRLWPRLAHEPPESGFLRCRASRK